jgi:hypothetical protein
MWLDDPLCPIDAQMTAMYQQLQATLQKQGVQVTVGAPLGMNILDFYPTYLNLLGSVTGAGQSPFVRYAMGLFAPVMAAIGKFVGAPKYFENYLRGVAQSHSSWLRVHEKRLRLMARFKPVFDQYDVILMPATATTAFKHLHKPELPMRKLVINGEKRGYTELFMWDRARHGHGPARHQRANRHHCTRFAGECANCGCGVSGQNHPQVCRVAGIGHGWFCEAGRLLTGVWGHAMISDAC